MSPWAIKNMRFDESLGQLHGYDYDFCLQVREAGKKVMTADFKAVHHHSLDLVTDEFVWIEAHKRVAEKWLGRMPAAGLPNWGAANDDWKGRALQAEAEAGAERLTRVSIQMKAEAQARRHKAGDGGDHRQRQLAANPPDPRGARGAPALPAPRAQARTAGSPPGAGEPARAAEPSRSPRRPARRRRSGADASGRGPRRGMIAYGVAVTRSEDYERWAGPGIERAREPDSVVLANSSPGPIFRAYNLLLDQAAAHEDLEALVLLHQDVEIVDHEFLRQGPMRRSPIPMSRCSGASGPRDVRTMAWWEGSVTWASFTHRYYEHGGGILPAFAMSPETPRGCRPTPASARSTRSTASSSCSPRGPCATSDSTSPSASSTATTTTSACRRARPDGR